MEGPWRITFDTNPDQCNLHCLMCEEHSLNSPKLHLRKEKKNKPRYMPFDIVQSVIKNCVDHGLKEIIPSTMGEPLLYDQFDRFIEICEKYNLKLNLTTNGTFPKRSTLDWAKMLIPICSDIKISFNGTTADLQESIMRGTKLEQIVKNVDTVVKIRDKYFKENNKYCSITLQVTFLESNFDDMTNIIRLGASLNVDRIKGHHVWVNFSSLESESLKRDEQSIQRWNSSLDKIYQAQSDYFRKNGEPVKLQNFVPIQVENKETAKDLVCPFLGKEAWINTVGDFSPCCAPDDLRKQLGNFGNVTTKPFMDLWNAEQYQKLTQNYQEHSLCRTCNMKIPRDSE